MTDTHSPAATGATPEPSAGSAPVARLAGVVREPVNLVIAVAAALALGLRIYQLARPGYLFGVTEYDDGVFFGNALRLADGAIPYRDFASVEPPGSALLMAPVALIAKVTGAAAGLAVARVLTVCADTACVILLGLLVRHRGVLAVVLACGIYAVFPGAIVAAPTFMLEPWLNLCCLAGAVLVFDGDRLAGSRRLAWGGALLGVAATVKIWAFVPAAVIGLLCLPRPRRAAAYAAGVIAGVLVPVLPFLILAPGALVRGVLVGELTRANGGLRPPLPRISRLTGLSGITSITPAGITDGALAIVAFVLLAYTAACLAARRPPSPLDGYALLGAAAVTLMLLWPSEFYPHYAAAAGPFLALVIALPAGWLAGGARTPAAVGHSGQLAAIRGRRLPAGSGRWLRGAAAVVATAAIGAMALAQYNAERPLGFGESPPAADRLIPPGACVLTDASVYTIAADRFTSDVPGCPLMVDALGTLITMTSGHDGFARPDVLNTVVQSWRTAFGRAQYVWLAPQVSGRIPWTPALYAYFTSHFRLIGLSNRHMGAADAPSGGLYENRDPPAMHTVPATNAGR